MKTRIGNLLLVALMIVAPLMQLSLANQKSVAANERSERAIKLEIVLNAPVEKVWKAWTTRDGIRSFFAPDCVRETFVACRASLVDRGARATVSAIADF